MTKKNCFYGSCEKTISVCAILNLQNKEQKLWKLPTCVFKSSLKCLYYMNKILFCGKIDRNLKAS